MNNTNVAVRKITAESISVLEVLLSSPSSLTIECTDKLPLTALQRQLGSRVVKTQMASSPRPFVHLFCQSAGSSSRSPLLTTRRVWHNLNLFSPDLHLEQAFSDSVPVGCSHKFFVGKYLSTHHHLQPLVLLNGGNKSNSHSPIDALTRLRARFFGALLLKRPQTPISLSTPAILWHSSWPCP